MLNIPSDYEPYKLNCTAGDAVVGILCRRPDGGVSDWHATMNRKAENGICPISGEEMKEVRTGVFVRKTGDILVVMTNSAATRAHLGRGAKATTHTFTSKPAPKRIMRKRKNDAVSRIAQQRFEPEIDINDAMAQAMKEAGL